MLARIFASSMFACAIGLFGLSAASNGLAAATVATAAAPPEEVGFVPLYVSGSRPLAMLTLGDNPPSPVAFDTGTDENILHASYASHLGLKTVGTGPLTDLGTGKTTMVPIAALPDPKLSGVAITISTAQLLDYHIADEVGVFGPNSFGDRLVILDAGMNRLRIVPRARAVIVGKGVPYHGSLPAYPITVNGRTLSAHLDSGNDDQLVLGEALIGKVRLKAPARVVAIAQSALGSKEVMGGQLDGELQIGPLRVRDPEVTFSGPGEGANVGFPIIRQLTLMLDPAHKRSWVLDPTGGPRQIAGLVGTYGPRVISVAGGKLIYQREGRPAFQLVYLGDDLFENPATGDRFQFHRKNGRATSFDLITRGGEVVQEPRS